MADISLLQKLGKITQFKKDETLFMQNDAGDCMYITLKGVFGVYINTINGFPLRVAGIPQGSYFGEMAVIDDSPRSATIIAEEDSAALVVDKGNFNRLLEEAPDIAQGIMDSLRNRHTATAETVREAGKEAADLPPLLKMAKYRDAKSSFAFLKELAKRLREMNALLGGAGDEQPLSAQETQKGLETIKLLPEGYSPLTMRDQNDNSFKLRTQNFYCPYCGMKTEGIVPVFSSLPLDDVYLDGRVVYKRFDILLYTNIVCSTCNYTDSYQEFGNHTFERQGEYNGDTFKNAEVFCGFDNATSRTVDEAVKSYYLNIACLKQVTRNYLRFAKAWIRLHWLFRDNNCQNLAKDTAAKAFFCYEKYIETMGTSIIPKDRIRFNAILGELAIYTNDMDSARQAYYLNTLVDKNLDKDFLQKCQKRYNEIK